MVTAESPSRVRIACSQASRRVFVVFALPRECVSAATAHCRRTLQARRELHANWRKITLVRVVHGSAACASPSSTTSPTNTFATPDTAITTFCDTELPVMDCISCGKNANWHHHELSCKTSAYPLDCRLRKRRPPEHLVTIQLLLRKVRHQHSVTQPISNHSPFPAATYCIFSRSSSSSFCLVLALDKAISRERCSSTSGVSFSSLFAVLGVLGSVGGRGREAITSVTKRNEIARRGLDESGANKKVVENANI